MQIGIIIGLVCVAAIVIVGGMLRSPAPAQLPATGMEILERAREAAATPAVFVPEVPRNATATTPVSSAPTPAGNGTFGEYLIAVTAEGFQPNSIVVKKGDVAKLLITATDAPYDFLLEGYGNYLAIPRGETKKVSFMPDTVGTFLFSCRDFCPSGKKIGGTFIVLPR